MTILSAVMYCVYKRHFLATKRIYSEKTYVFDNPKGYEEAKSSCLPKCKEYCRDVSTLLEISATGTHQQL